MGESTDIEILVRNRQRGRRIDVGRVRRLAEILVRDEKRIDRCSLGIELVSATTMARLNWRWLRHEGSTDVLTFDHRETPDGPMKGELVISVDDAVVQAARFGASPSEELMRYVIHGVLHLTGYDDLEPAKRRVMKREENRLLKRLRMLGSMDGIVGRPTAALLERRRNRTWAGAACRPIAADGSVGRVFGSPGGRGMRGAG